MYVSWLNDAILEYRVADVLMPDVITDAMAKIASTEINREHPSSKIRLLELGVGAAPFLAQVATGVRGDVPLQLDGIDIDESVMEFAAFNVERALARRGNPGDGMSLTVQSWDALLDGRHTYDFIYANLPYLPAGEVVRPEFQNAPPISMYVAGGTDGLDYYREVLPRMAAIMNPGARLFVRTPRDMERYDVILDIANNSFAGKVAIHAVRAEAELGLREGRGFIVELADTEARSFSVEPVRTIGLALIEKLTT